MLIFLAAAPAGAATLNLCPGSAAPADSRPLDHALRPSGEQLQLLLHATQLPACEALAIEQPLRWARIIGRDSAQRLAGGLMLQTARGETRSAPPQDVIALAEEPAAAKPPPRVNNPQPERPPAQSGAATPPRALWIWQPQQWLEQPEKLLEQLTAHGAGAVYITVPLIGDPPEVEHAAALQRFVTAAGQRGIRVWAVAGDPRAVLPDERGKYAALANALTYYNRHAPPPARLAGLQLDIEPYLNRGYAHDPEGWLAAYVETLAAIRPRADMPLDVAVPFWWGRQRLRGGPFLDALKPLVDMVTVMNYRTDPQQLAAFAEPFLAWGAANGKRIRIGLESGPIADEALHVYRRSDAGELWLVNIGKQHAALLLLEGRRANPAGLSFSHSHSINRGGEQTTFQRSPETLRKLLPQLEERWRAWPSFDGVALHGLD